jgi:hypothetical protein
MYSEIFSLRRLVDGGDSASLQEANWKFSGTPAVQVLMRNFFRE